MLLMLELLLLLACYASPGLGDLYSSMAHLQSALYAERDIAVEIRQYINKEQARLDNLAKVAEEFEAHSNKALENPDYYLGNPVNAYLFIKHFTLDWDKDIETTLKNNSRKELTDRIDILKDSLPTYEDLSGSVNALLRLQDTYKLDTAEIALGNVGGVKSTELSVWDCFELGRLAYNEEDYFHTISWMEEALVRHRAKGQDTDDAHTFTASIIDYLAFSLYKQGNIRKALALTNEMLAIDPTHERALSNKEYYEKMVAQQDKDSRKRGDDADITNDRHLDEYRNGEEFRAYEALCRGETTKEYKDEHRLFCRYRTNNDPLLLISPLKEEVVFLDPFITMFHDSITDSEISMLKNVATPKLGRATVHNPKTGKLETAQYRVSKSCWLNEYDNPELKKINNRIGAATGLNMATAEELQIANYGIGGQYEPHFDFARKREPTAFEARVGNRMATFMYYKEETNAFKSLGTGNRIATLMYYMSDVQAGGATVFPYIGLKIFPKKGRSVFWYNLYKNGEGIYNTRHAACPVLVGSKWVGNKWIHERGQEHKRPCGIYEDE